MSGGLGAGAGFFLRGAGFFVVFFLVLTDFFAPAFDSDARVDARATFPGVFLRVAARLVAFFLPEAIGPHVHYVPKQASTCRFEASADHTGMYR